MDMNRFGYLIVICLAACGGGTSASDAGGTDGGGADSGNTGNTGGGPSFGQSFLSGVSLTECNDTGDTGNDITIDFSAADYTVVSLASVNCAPCIEETKVLAAEIITPFASKNVAVYQTLTTFGGASANATECMTWSGMHPLEGRVQMRDPDGDLMTYWPTGALPSTLIVDSNGMIVYHEIGATNGIDGLKNKLNELTE